MTEYTEQQLKEAALKAYAAGDTAAAEELAKAAMSARGTSKATRGTSVVEQFMGGANERLAATLGAPVDLATAGLNKLARGVGLPEITQPIGGRQTFEGLFGAISGGAAIPEVGPQTAPQRIARRAGEELGGAIPMAVGLPLGGAMLPRGGSALQRGVAAISDAAKANPLGYASAETAAALGGGLGAGVAREVAPGSAMAELAGQIGGAVTGAGALRAAERAATPVPRGPASAADMKQAASSLYDSQRVNGLRVPPSVISPARNSARQIASEQGIVMPNGRIDPDYPKVNSVLHTLDAYAKGGMSGAQLLAVRRGISDRAHDAAGTSEGVVLRRILQAFDAETSKLAPEIATANQMWARAAKADTIETMLNVAGLRKGKFSQSGLENAIRTEFRNLAIKIERGQEFGWSPDEVKQINAIAEGGSLENAMRFVGRFAPKGVVSIATAGGIPYSAVMQATGDPTAAALAAGGVMATGAAANTAAGRMQANRAQQLYENILSGRKLAPEADARLRAAIEAYLAGVAAQDVVPQ